MSESNEPWTKANVLPAMKTEEVIARAQRILDLRGRPPYVRRYSYNESGAGPGGYHTEELSEDEAAVLSDFVYHWLPFLVVKP